MTASVLMVMIRSRKRVRQSSCRRHAAISTGKSRHVEWPQLACAGVEGRKQEGEAEGAGGGDSILSDQMCA